MANKRLTDPEEINRLKQDLLKGEFPIDLATKYGIGIASVHNWKKKFEEEDKTLQFPAMRGKKRAQAVEQIDNKIKNRQVHQVQQTQNKQVKPIKSPKTQVIVPEVAKIAASAHHYVINGVKMAIPDNVEVEIDPSAKHVIINKDRTIVEF